MPTDALDPNDRKFIRTSPLAAIDWRFGVILGVSIACNFAFAMHLNAQPLPAWSEIVEPDRPAGGVHLPPLRPIPKPPKTAAAPVKGHSAPPVKPGPAKKAEVDLSTRGLLAPLTSFREGGHGAFDDVISRSGGIEVKDALQGASTLKVATTADEMPNAPKAGEQHVATIGNVGADRVGDVRLGEHRDSKLVGVVIDDPPEAPGLDPGVLRRFLAARRSAVQYCYERELKHSPTLAGRIVVRLTVTPAGRAEDVEIDENTMNSDAVGRCVRNLVSGWVLPVRPEQDASISIPYIFSRAN